MATQVSGAEQSNIVKSGKHRAIWGWALLAPALLCCLSELLIPTVRTFSMSLQEMRLPGEAGNFVGLENYVRLFQDQMFTGAVGFTLLLMGVRLLVVIIAPVVLALVVNQFGRKVRIPVRLLYTLPIVLFAPVVIALTWMAALNPVLGLWSGQALADPQRARQTLLLMDMLYTLGLAGGAGLIVYLAALRTENMAVSSRKKMLVPLAACWLVGLLATVAFSLQSFSTIFVMTRGGPANSTLTLGIYQYLVTFQRMRFGYGAAIAGLNLLVVMVLGIAAGLVVIWVGLHLKSVSRDKGTTLFSEMNKPLATGLLIVILLVSLSMGALSTLPLFWNTLNAFKTEADMLSAQFFPTAPSMAAFARLRESIPLARVFINTIVPLTGAVLFIQLPLAYLGALGLGAFRPLGRRSEWLLLPFSPWLFVGTIALSPTLTISVRGAGMFNTLPGLAPPILLSVPMLFVLTLFFKGQAPHWEAAQAEGQPAVNAFFRQLVRPSLPLAALLGGITIWVELQALLWPLIVASSPNRMTIMTALLRLAMETGMPGIPVVAAGIALLWLPLAILFFLFLGVFQIFYLDRLSISR